MDDVEGLIFNLKHAAQHHVPAAHQKLVLKAATALTLAQARIRELETALKPFSHLDYTYQRVSRDGWMAVLYDEAKRANHLLRARQAPKEAPDV